MKNMKKARNIILKIFENEKDYLIEIYQDNQFISEFHESKKIIDRLDFEKNI